MCTFLNLSSSGLEGVCVCAVLLATLLFMNKLNKTESDIFVYLMCFLPTKDIGVALITHIMPVRNTRAVRKSICNKETSNKIKYFASKL